jgi:hypothetical protein
MHVSVLVFAAAGIDDMVLANLNPGVLVHPLRRKFRPRHFACCPQVLTAVGDG